MLDQVWSDAAIERCLQHGIDHFFLAPGSRCTPLTLAVARCDKAHVIQHFDERGLAFAALGYARATGKPGVFICTSGTAVANALPAVIEASTDCVPMLLFTADRPEELRGSGANQTIDQRNLFGVYAKLFLDLSVPSDSGKADTMQILYESVQQSIDAAMQGPAHLNWMFREPFSIDDPAAPQSRSLASVDAETESQPTTLEVSGNVLMALGSCQPSVAKRARELAASMSAPMLCDVTSGTAGLSFELPSEFSLPRPDTILHLGGRIVSKSWLRWTESIRDQNVSFIHITPTGQTINPNRLPQTQIKASIKNLQLVQTGNPINDSFTSAWHRAGAIRGEVLQRLFDKPNSPLKHAFSEPAIARRVSRLYPDSEALFIGNSTPIRDLDWYGVRQTEKVRHIAANRGASGIDGLLATATGYAAGLKMRTTVLIGDLSALHDLNSLALVAKSKWPLIVIVINNQGGHIFDLLPVRQSPHFEQFFNTPHSFKFEHAAKMFGIDHQRITTMADFDDHYREKLAGDGSVLLELVTNRDENMQVRNTVAAEIRKCRLSQ